jgi:metal-sulfur cluster biosynthetic enzyme
MTNKDSTKNTQTTVTESQVYDALKNVFDPEIPVSIVDLGLVYDVKIIDDWVGVKMTLTTPGCGMGQAIAGMVRERVLTLPGVSEADVRLVWEPAWSPAMMSDTAKKKLGMS